MASQTHLEMTLYVGPLGSDNAVYHRIADAPIPARPMMADHPVFLGTQGFDGPLRGEVEVVSPQADHLAPESIERVSQQQKFAASVDVAPLPALAVPRVADFDAIYFRHNVVVACAPNNGATREVSDRPR
jgi:hypothetical protein